METVEFRINNGNLEYRCLLIHERSVNRDNELSGDKLFIDCSNRYTDWKPIPTIKKEGGKKC